MKISLIFINVKDTGSSNTSLIVHVNVKFRLEEDENKDGPTQSPALELKDLSPLSSVNPQRKQSSLLCSLLCAPNSVDSCGDTITDLPGERWRVTRFLPFAGPPHGGGGVVT